MAARLPLTATHLVVVAGVLAVALAATAWVMLSRQAQPAPLEAVTPVAEAPKSDDAAPDAADPEPAPNAAVPVSTPDSPNASGEVTVDVAGKVRRPGIAVLPAGSRVVDALQAAGGARSGVDLTSLNLARLLVDGEQIVVGLPPPAPVGAAAASGAPSPGAATPGGLVNLNTADAAALDTLPGVGPVTAEAILNWRAENGGFTAVEELLEVDGIGDATLADIAPYVTV